MESWLLNNGLAVGALPLITWFLWWMQRRIEKKLDNIETKIEAHIENDNAHRTRDFNIRFKRVEDRQDRCLNGKAGVVDATR